MAVEAATGCTVETARFSYCTTAGGFTAHDVQINERTRRMGIEALEIIDRSVELGTLVPVPAERACSFCDFISVCGPNQERRARRKSREQIGDVIELRSRP
jgi:CRISPR/Cas system-associated exonuclease Cas4 (RecB family)